jgi:prepilin-type N-terminal cleavage/methylation domain-containing protein
MNIRAVFRYRLKKKGFTLIETLVAISILMIAILPPMELTMESLSAAYYARDQVTASNLAQEAIEVIRSVRDSNILQIAEGNPNIDIFNGIPLSTSGTLLPFTVDSTVIAANALVECVKSGSQFECPPLQTNGNVYAYGCSSYSTNTNSDGLNQWDVTDCGSSSQWTDTIFTRSVIVTQANTNPDELKVSVTVTWREGAYQNQTYTINDDLYRWISDDTGT